MASIQDVPLGRLKDEEGIRGLLVDLDNTLVPWNDRRPLPGAVQAWLRGVEEAGLRLAVLSNGVTRRVTATMSEPGIPFIAAAGKPRRRAFRRGLDLLELEAHEVAMVGDQLFTDVLGAKRMGLYAVLVQPLSPREFVTTRVVRRLERWLLGRLRARDMLSCSRVPDHA